MGEERLTDHHRRVLCELIGRLDGWWCPHCERVVEGVEVTYQEFHEHCGFRVEAQGEFHGTWHDYGACIEAITKQGDLPRFLNWFHERRRDVFDDTWHAWERMSPKDRCLEIAEFILNRKEKG